jgi:hypothetical protein
MQFNLILLLRLGQEIREDQSYLSLIKNKKSAAMGCAFPIKPIILPRN